MSEGLYQLMKKHPRYFAQYRKFVVETVMDNPRIHELVKKRKRNLSKLAAAK